MTTQFDPNDPTRFEEMYRDERVTHGLPGATPWDIGGPQPVVQQLVALGLALSEADTDEYLRCLLVPVPVAELRDVLPAQQFAEPQKRPRRFRHLHGEQRLTLCAQVRALGYVPQPVEIHVGAAVDRDEHASGAVLPRHVFLDSRNGQGAGGLGNGARILKNILDGGADLIRGHQDDLIDVLPGELDCEGIAGH